MKVKFLVVLLFVFSCSKKDYINDYGEYLKIEFPKDLNRVYMKNHAEFQDFQNFSIYTLTNPEVELILGQVRLNLCDSTDSNNKLCWNRYDDFYSLKLSDSLINSGYYLKVIITSKNKINTILIEEVHM